MGVRAVRGAAWTVSAGLATRVAGMVGTVLLTYLLDPSVIGEVAGASIVVMSANQLAIFGVGQYVIARKDAGRDVVWHATVVHQVLGLVVVLPVLALSHRAAAALHSPHLAEYAPGFVASVLVDRVGFIPERVLARDMRFRAVGLTRGAGEIVYTASALGLAALGLGGMAIVWANLVRSVLRAGLFVAAVDWREWLKPHPLNRPLLRDMARFGWPLCLGSIAEFASRRWDNLGVARLFGPAVMGEYNQAYNLAEVPGNQIGEQMGDVLLPALAGVDCDAKRRALVRSVGLMALIVFPLSVGLGAVAPTLVTVLLRPTWRGIAPMLAVLSLVSVARPFGWMVDAYLQSRGATRAVLWLDVSKAVSLVAFVVLFGRGGPLWACAGVVASFALNAVASFWSVKRLDGIPMRAFLAECARPLAACAPMLAGVLAVRAAFAHAGVHASTLALLLETAAGAAAYTASARALARERSEDLLRLLRDAISGAAARSVTR